MKNSYLIFLAQAIGIIGGADGDNAISVTNSIILLNNSLHILKLIGGALILCGLFCLIFNKTVKENCTLKTSGISLAISAVTALGLYCATTFALCFVMTHPSKHPIALPASIIIGILCLIALILLLRIYCKQRKEKPSAKGIVIDILFAVIYIIPLFSVYQSLHNIISVWIG